MTKKELTERVKRLQQSVYKLNRCYCYTESGKLRDSASRKVSGALRRAEIELGALWLSLVETKLK